MKDDDYYKVEPDYLYDTNFEFNVWWLAIIVVVAWFGTIAIFVR